MTGSETTYDVMVYYNLVPEEGYEGITKHCGLTIDEVDSNFYLLDKRLTDLGRKVDECCRKLTRQTFYVDSTPYSDTPNTDLTFTPLENDGYDYELCGKVDYDYSKGGNFVKLALASNLHGLKNRYPNATCFISYSMDYEPIPDTGSENSLWNHYDEEHDVFLFDIEILEGGTKYALVINWNDETDEYEKYSYYICENIIIESGKYHYSRTYPDRDAITPGTSPEAEYTLDYDGYEMNICGTVEDYDGENKVGLVIVPVKDEHEWYTDVEELYNLFPNAKYYVGSHDMGSIYDAIDSNPDGYPIGIYFQPIIEKDEEGKVWVSLGPDLMCSGNILTVTVEWEENLIETYNYIVCEDIILEGE